MLIFLQFSRLVTYAKTDLHTYLQNRNITFLKS